MKPETVSAHAWTERAQVDRQHRPRPPRKSNPASGRLDHRQNLATRPHQPPLALPPPHPRRDSEFSEIEFVAGDTEVFDDVRDDSAGHVARMPGIRNQTIPSKRIGVMPVTARRPQQFTTDFAKPPIQLTAVVGRVLAHASGRKDEFVAEGRWNRPTGFQQRLQMGFRGLLKAEQRLAPVASVRVATGQQAGFGNPHAIFIPSKSHFCERNDHRAKTITRHPSNVKSTLAAPPVSPSPPSW